MKRIVIHALIALSVLNFPLAAWAASQPEANATAETAPPQEHKEKKNSVTVTYGTYSLAHNSQDWSVLGPYSCAPFLFFWTLCGNSVTPLDNRFNTFAHDVGGLEYERKLGRHFAYGATWFHAKNTFTTPSLTSATGVAKADFVLATMTAYLREPGTVQPFVGIGAGEVWASFSGSVGQSLTGDAYMARAGLRYETEGADFVLGFRKIQTKFYGLNLYGNAGTVVGALNLDGGGPYVGAGLRF